MYTARHYLADLVIPSSMVSKHDNTNNQHVSRYTKCTKVFHVYFMYTDESYYTRERVIRKARPLNISAKPIDPTTHKPTHPTHIKSHNLWITQKYTKYYTKTLTFNSKI